MPFDPDFDKAKKHVLRRSRIKWQNCRVLLLVDVSFRCTLERPAAFSLSPVRMERGGGGKIEGENGERG